MAFLRGRATLGAEVPEDEDERDIVDYSCDETLRDALLRKHALPAGGRGEEQQRPRSAPLTFPVADDPHAEPFIHPGAKSAPAFAPHELQALLQDIREGASAAGSTASRAEAPAANEGRNDGNAEGSSVWQEAASRQQQQQRGRWQGSADAAGGPEAAASRGGWRAGGRNGATQPPSNTPREAQRHDTQATQLQAAAGGVSKLLGGSLHSALRAGGFGGAAPAAGVHGGGHKASTPKGIYSSSIAGSGSGAGSGGGGSGRGRGAKGPKFAIRDTRGGGDGGIGPLPGGSQQRPGSAARPEAALLAGPGAAATPASLFKTPALPHSAFGLRGDHQPRIGPFNNASGMPAVNLASRFGTPGTAAGPAPSGQRGFSSLLGSRQEAAAAAPAVGGSAPDAAPGTGGLRDANGDGCAWRDDVSGNGADDAGNVGHSGGDVAAAARPPACVLAEEAQRTPAASRAAPGIDSAAGGLPLALLGAVTGPLLPPPGPWSTGRKASQPPGSRLYDVLHSAAGSGGASSGKKGRGAVLRSALTPPPAVPPSATKAPGEVLSLLGQQRSVRDRLLAALPAPSAAPAATPLSQSAGHGGGYGGFGLSGGFGSAAGGVGGIRGGKGRGGKAAPAGSLTSKLQWAMAAVKAQQERLAAGQPPALHPLAPAGAAPAAAGGTGLTQAAVASQAAAAPVAHGAGTSQAAAGAAAGGAGSQAANAAGSVPAGGAPLRLQVLGRPQFEAHMMKFACRCDAPEAAAAGWLFVPSKAVPADIAPGGEVTVLPPWHLLPAGLPGGAQILLAHVIDSGPQPA